ncbi:hypothetical protein EDB86DRAFT_3100314 [Lactarius hatsudake]|nr:hypothetical protein EDB86DRAFT_3100314 [Lactarius hatsudake]
MAVIRSALAEHLAYHRLLDSVYPDTVLGKPKQTAAHVAEPGTGKKKRKKAKHGHPSLPQLFAVGKTAHNGGRGSRSSILSLSWNRTTRQMIASGSADRAVKLWDLSRNPKESALRSFGKLHMDKVQAVQWNPTDPAVRELRSHGAGVRLASVGAVVGADVSLENGMVVNFDARTLPSDLDQPSPARFTIAAHDGAPCALNVNAHIRGCLATAGTDKMVKIWNVQEHEDGRGLLGLVSRRPFNARRCGLKSEIADLGRRREHWYAQGVWTRLAEAGRKLRERSTGGVIGVADDEEDSDDEEE